MRASAYTRGLAIAFACMVGSASAEPVVLHDALDRTVVLPRPARRIVTIFASNTEMVAALGIADRIVGIESYTRFPPEVLDRPLVGGRLGFSVDAVVAQNPDIVVVTPSRQAAHQLVDPMERLGVPILVLMQRSVDEILINIRLLGRAAGVEQEADAVVGRLETRIAKLAARVRDRAPPRVVMITGQIGSGLVLVARPRTYTGDAIVLAGGRFALGNSVALAQVSPEAILRADPDVLLFAGRKEALDSLLRQPGWNDMRAVRTGRAYTVARAEFLIPGPRTIDGIERLATLLHPEADRR